MANTFYNKGFSGVYNNHMPKSFTEGADFFCDQDGQFIGGAALVASSVFAAAEVLPAAVSAVLNTGRWIQRGASLKNTWNRLSGSSKSHNKPAQNSPKNVFPKKPENLLTELPRDAKGRIYVADNLRIRPEKHPMQPGEIFNKRHHGQHFHIEYRRNSSYSWNNKRNLGIIKPKNYKPGSGTGFIPGEKFPGL